MALRDLITINNDLTDAQVAAKQALYAAEDACVVGIRASSDRMEQPAAYHLDALQTAAEAFLDEVDTHAAPSPIHKEQAAMIVAEAVTVARAEVYARGEYNLDALRTAITRARMLAVQGATRGAS